MSEPTYKIAQRLHARRAAKGLTTYGRHLDADSQGCMLVHALEESADKTNYLIAEIQRRRESLILLIEVAKYLKAEGQYGYGDTIATVIDLLGGESALAQYDEILGGGTVAQNVTVAPGPRDELEAAREEVRRLTQAVGDLRTGRDRAVKEAQRQDGVAKGLRAERDALAADNARLRKALEGIAAFAEEDISELTGVAGQMVCFFCGYVPHEEKCPHTITTAALAATPAQSLAAHDAALLREVAKQMDPDGGCYEALMAEADRIAKEAANG